MKGQDFIGPIPIFQLLHPVSFTADSDMVRCRRQPPHEPCDTSSHGWKFGADDGSEDPSENAWREADMNFPSGFETRPTAGCRIETDTVGDVEGLLVAMATIGHRR